MQFLTAISTVAGMKFTLPLVRMVLLVAVFSLNFGAVTAELPAKSATLLQPFVDRHALAGAVALVASGDKVLSVETVGFADIKAQKAMTENALFWIASQSKPMTAAAVMMLVDEGKLSLDDAVEKYLPEFKGQMVIAEKDGEHVLLKKPTHPIMSATSSRTPAGWRSSRGSRSRRWII